MTTPTTPEAALATALHLAYHTAKEAGAVTVEGLTTLMASHALAALDDWELVPAQTDDQWWDAVNRWRGIAETKQAEIIRLREALEVRPETLPQPNGPIVRKWWRLGWLSAQAVARAALAPEAER